MAALKRIFVRSALVATIGVLAAACAGPPTVRTAVGQDETIAAAAQAVASDVSPATRVAAYCAIEATAVETLRPFRQPNNPPNVAAIATEAASLAVTVAEVAPDEIADALRVQRSALHQIDAALDDGTFGALGYGRAYPRYAKRSPVFLSAVATIAAFDRDVCGIS